MTEAPTIPPLKLIAIVLIRVAVLGLLALASVLLHNDVVVLYTLTGFALALSIPYALRLRDQLGRKPFAASLFYIDLTLVTALIYLTGGLQSNLTLLYPLVILCAAIAGSPRQAAQITVISIITYAAMNSMLARQLLKDYRPDIALAAPSAIISVGLRSLLFAGCGALGATIAKHCTLNSAAAEPFLFQTTHALLYKNPFPALLLNSDGFIVLANAAACEKLERTEAELCSNSFSELQTAGGPPIPEAYGTTCRIHRSSGIPLTISYKTAALKLPDAALHYNSTQQNTVHALALLVFSDISRELKLDDQLEKAERMAEATQLAGEMAHEIRTPLTSISASVQLLKHYEERTTSADWLPNSPRRRDRTELFGHIEDASVQLNKVIQSFLDFTEFSPEDLLSIIKLDYTGENQSYIGHLNTIGKGFTNGQNSDCRRRSNDSQPVE